MGFCLSCSRLESICFIVQLKLRREGRREGQLRRSDFFSFLLPTSRGWGVITGSASPGAKEKVGITPGQMLRHEEEHEAFLFLS